MKKTILFALLLAISFSACKSSKTGESVATMDIRKIYVPQQVKDTYFGLSRTDFLKMRTSNVEVSDIVDFRTEITETFSKGDVKNITYYFDKDGNQPLYEYIVEYNDNINVKEIANAKFGTPNSEGEWLMDSKEGYQIKAWTFNQKIVIAAAMNQTEWKGEF